MRYLVILFLFLTLKANAQKLGILENAIAYASDYDYRFTSKSSLRLEEEKKILADIQQWIVKLKPYVNSSDPDEKVPAIWAVTHFYRQASFIYSYFNDSTDDKWNTKGATTMSEAIAFKNKYYRPTAVKPVSNNVDVTFSDTTFMNIALDAYAVIIASRQKDFIKAANHLSKLPIKPFFWQDEEAPIVTAYLYFISTSSSKSKTVYSNLLKLLKATDWYDFKSSELSGLIKNLNANIKTLGYQMLMDYSALLFEKCDSQPENLHTIYTTAASYFIRQTNYVIKLDELQQRLRWENFVYGAHTNPGDKLEIQSLVDDLLIILKRNYPLKAPPTIVGKSDPATELLDGIYYMLNGHISEEKFKSISNALDKHIEEPYSKAAAKAIAAINIK